MRIVTARCRHRRERRGRSISVTNYILQRLIPAKSAAVSNLSFFRDDKVSVSKSTNLSGFTDSTTGAFCFFSGQLYLTLSSIIAIDYLVINDWARARKAAKNWVKQPSLKNQVPLHALLQLVRLKKNIYIYV